MPTKKDLTGQRFGKLTAIRDVGSNGRNRLWECKCDCGNVHIASSGVLLGGHIKSCGCYREEFRKLDGQEAAKKRLIGVYKTESKKRNVPFTLTDEEFFQLTSQNCYYCGIEPQNVIKPTHYDSREPERWFTYTGIDRLDSSKGYELTNVVPSCWVCNRAKVSMSEEQFKSWIKRVYTHLFKKLVEKTPGELIDSLVTVLMKCWYSQEDMLNHNLSNEEKAKAGERAQEMNDRRNKLIRSIDELLDFSADSPTEKTYHTYFNNK